MEENPSIKILLLGDVSVGKTSIFLQFSENTFQENRLSTIGIDFRNKEITLENNKKFNISIWDTSGQERFRAITKNYYKNAHGFLLVYDVTEQKTFDGIKNWISTIKEYANPDIQFMIVANKCDSDKRVVSTYEGQKMADQYECMFIETSAKLGKNINEAIMSIVKKIDEEVLVVEEKEIKLQEHKPREEASRCCLKKN